MATEKDTRAKKRVAEGVFKRGTGKSARYLVPILENGKRKWYTLPEGTTIGEAKQFKRDKEAAKKRARGKRDYTVQEFAASWTERFPRPSESTNKHNAQQVRAFTDEYATEPLRDFDPDLARTWALKHPSDVPALRAMFNDAIKVRAADFNPFANLGLEQSRGRKDITALTAQEVDTICGIAKRVHGKYGEHFADMFRVAAWTGLRPGELMALTPERVNLDEPVIEDGQLVRDGKYIDVVEAADQKTGRLKPTKNKRRRRVTVLPEAERALRRVMEYRAAGEFLFAPKNAQHRKNRLTGEVIDPRWHRNGIAAFIPARLHFYWDPVRAAFTASLPSTHWLVKRGESGNLDWYEARHTFGSALAARGATPYEVADQLGHQDGGKLAMEVYIHTDNQRARARLRELFAA